MTTTESGAKVIAGTDAWTDIFKAHNDTVEAYDEWLADHVDGPESSDADAVAVFDGTTGKLIKSSGYTIEKSVPANAAFTDTTYAPATTTQNGLMSSDDKLKLDNSATELIASNIPSTAVPGSTNVEAALLSLASGKAAESAVASALLAIADLQARTNAMVLAPTAPFLIPSSGTSVSKNMTGLTANHVLIRWGFSASDESDPPATLSCAIYDGYFTVTNSNGTTSETIRPVFALPTAVALTNRT